MKRFIPRTRREFGGHEEASGMSGISGRIAMPGIPGMMRTQFVM